MYRSFCFFIFSFSICRISIYDTHDLNSILEAVSEWTYPAAVLLSRNFANSSQNIHLIKEDLFVLSSAIVFPKNSYLIEPFNRVITQAIETGLIDHWTKTALRLGSDLTTDSGLSLKHVGCSIIVWIIGLTLASVFFIFELSFDLWKKSARGARYRRLNKLIDETYYFVSC